MGKNNPYTDKKLTKMKDQKDPWVMYIVIRKSLLSQMSVGKIAVQFSHAVNLIDFKYFEYEQFPIPGKQEMYTRAKDFRDWKNEGIRKIAKKASDAKFEKIKKELDCFVVKDAGLTEISPGTETTLAIWPVRRSKVPEIIYKLQNL